MGARRLTSWIQSFTEETAGKGSPPIFCLWSGIATVAAALERKVWLTNRKGILHPNQYILLVGPPGGGKTLAIGSAMNYMETLNGPNGHKIASSNLSRASLVDDLRDAERRVVHPDKIPSVMSFNALAVFADELSVFMPEYQNDFLSILNHIYTGQPYSERKRTRDLQFSIPNPTLNMIAGTQPGYLSEFLPEAAWNQGFLSRTVLVYNGEQILQPLWGISGREVRQHEYLVEDLRSIGDMYGEMTFEKEAADAIQAWHLAGGPPKPEHPKLTYYNMRRTAHVLKLSMIASASRSDSLRVGAEDYQQALDWLTQAEQHMPDIFKAMQTGGDIRAIEECWYFCYEIWMREKQGTVEARVVTFLSERVPAHAVMRIIELMVRGNLMEKKMDSKLGYVYFPKNKRGKG